MFESVISAFTKFFSKERVLALILFLILIWALYSYAGSKTAVLDNMDTGSIDGPKQNREIQSAQGRGPGRRHRRNATSRNSQAVETMVVVWR